MIIFCYFKVFVFRNKAIYSLCTSPLHMKRLLYKIPINSISQCVPMPKNPISLSHSFPLGYVSILNQFKVIFCTNLYLWRPTTFQNTSLPVPCPVLVPMPMSLVYEVEKQIGFLSALSLWRMCAP